MLNDVFAFAVFVILLLFGLMCVYDNWRIARLQEQIDQLRHDFRQVTITVKRRL